MSRPRAEESCSSDQRAMSTTDTRVGPACLILDLDHNLATTFGEGRAVPVLSENSTDVSHKHFFPLRAKNSELRPLPPLNSASKAMGSLLNAVSALWRPDAARRQQQKTASSYETDIPIWSPSTASMASPSLPHSAAGQGSYAPSGAIPGSPVMRAPSHPSSSHSAYTQTYPPLKHTCARLRSALHATVPETLDTLNYPITIPAYNALQTSLRCTLPQDVKDYLLAMDGQDIYSANGSNLGALWGQLWLMSSEEIIAEWQLLRRMEDRQAKGLQVVDDPFAEYAAAAVPLSPESCPPGWVRRQYSHPAWIPLARDDSGNYIGIDLDPPPPPSFGDGRNSQLNSSQTSISSRSSVASQQQQQADQPLFTPCSGQVIAFGRDIEGKVVLNPGWASQGAGGWARFLASAVDDLEAGEFASLGVIHSSAARPSLEQSSYGKRGGGTAEELESGGGSGLGPSASSSGPSGSDEEDQSDGIGELGYFEQHEVDNDYDSDDQLKNSKGVAGFKKYRATSRGARHWKLEPRYRGLTFVEALAERSKDRWRQMGYAPRKPRSKRWSGSQPRTSQDQLSVSSRNSRPSGLGVQLEEAESPEVEQKPTIETSAPADESSESSSAAAGAAQEPQPPASPSLIFSPASPSRKDTAEMPPEEATPRAPAVERQQPLPRHRSLPPPASIDIPTADDLLADDDAAGAQSPFSPGAPLASPSHISVNMG